MAIAPELISIDDFDDVTLVPDYDYDDDGYAISDGLPMAETDKHDQLATYFKEGLKDRYRERSHEVYVSGNNFVHYHNGNRNAFISPDVYVVFGPEQRLRDNYKSWQEGGHTPAVVFEFTSRKTRREDVEVKFPLYEQVLRVPEYFQFDPTGDYLNPRLQGFRLIEGVYHPLEMVDNRIVSEQLGLYLVMEGENLRAIDILTGEPLRTLQSERNRAETERHRAEAERLQKLEAQAREEAERDRAEQAEAELAQLRAQFEALRKQQS